MSLHLDPGGRGPRLPVLALLHPREHTPAVLATLALGVLAAALAMRVAGLPLWGATATLLALLLIPGTLKWRADARRYGATATLLSVLLAAQGFHAIEHIVQWAQNHLLGWSLRASTGLLSPANAEWVHFVWNWLVLLTVIALLRGGMRGRWAWLLLAWATAHTLEHTYLMARHLLVLDELGRLGVRGITAQGLPGVLGRDGWLARSELTRGTFLCDLPGLTTASRLDVHFWWNVGETALLLLAANAFMRRRFTQGNP
jgi:hypothetical protein